MSPTKTIVIGCYSPINKGILHGVFQLANALRLPVAVRDPLD